MKRILLSMSLIICLWMAAVSPAHADAVTIEHNGLWLPSTQNQLVVWAWILSDFKKKYDEMSGKGYRLIAQQAYDIGGGQIRYDGIWNPSTQGQFVVWGYNIDNFQKAYTDEWNKGYRLAGEQVFVVSSPQATPKPPPAVAPTPQKSTDRFD